MFFSLKDCTALLYCFVVLLLWVQWFYFLSIMNILHGFPEHRIVHQLEESFSKEFVAGFLSSIFFSIYGLRYASCWRKSLYGSSSAWDLFKDSTECFEYEQHTSPYRSNWELASVFWCASNRSQYFRELKGGYYDSHGVLWDTQGLPQG